MSQLMGFALKSRPSLMVSVAEYLEDKGELEKAVQLYQKAGEVTKALDLCFRAGGAGESAAGGGSAGEGDPATSMFEALKSMMDDLGSHASPQVRSFAPVGFFPAVGFAMFLVLISERSLISTGTSSRGVRTSRCYYMLLSEPVDEFVVSKPWLFFLMLLLRL